jgi:hypothetical protein
MSAGPRELCGGAALAEGPRRGKARAASGFMLLVLLRRRIALTDRARRWPDIVAAPMRAPS